MKKFLTLYTKTALILTNTLLLFVTLNLLCFFIASPANYDHYVTTPKVMLKTNPALLQKIHEGKSLADISDLYKSIPNIKSHPVLELMTTPCSGKFYNVGFENSRYNEFVSKSNIKQLMNQSTWLMGGSTTFGPGVADNETFAYFLNKFDTAHHYINFGSLSYHQRQEIEKLIILLQKGYRPKRVIFLDGLNDLTQLIASNFEPGETPTKPFNAYAQDFCVSNLGINKNLIYALPLVKLGYHYMASVTVNPHEDIYDERALYNTKPYLHYRVTELYKPEIDSSLLNKVDRYYQENLILLDALSKAYHFDYIVFFQPIGLMLDRNPFISDLAAFKKEFIRYEAFKASYLHVKQGIKNNKFPHFYDLSMVHEQCQYPYVDLTHYSKSMNELLAREILSRCQPSAKPYAAD